MLTPVPPTDCTTAREAASAVLDGELSELETVQLDAHLRGCAECSAHARELGALVVRLRAEPLEQPSLPVFVSRRRRPAGRLQLAAAAVTLVAAAGSAFAIGHRVGSHGGSPSATVGTTLAGSSARPRDEVLGMLRRLRLGRMTGNRVIPV